MLTFSKVISLFVCGVCFFCSFTQFLLVFLVFHRKDLVLLNLISRYAASAISDFWKIKMLLTFIKLIFNVSEWLIQCNTDSCCEYVIGGANMYLWVSLLVSISCVYLFVCMIPNSHVINVKPTANLMPCCIKCRSRCLRY